MAQDAHCNTPLRQLCGATEQCLVPGQPSVHLLDQG
jgi:hypothetical protein